MAKKPLPTPAELRQLLDYDAETGAFTWRPRPMAHFGRAQDWRMWNTVHAGAPAGSFLASGYRQIKIGGVPILAHRLAFAVHRGEWPSGHIDHINGDRGDNRILNLRVVTRSENAKNRKRGANNTTGVVGVYRARSGRFKAGIGRCPAIHLGTFDTFREAAAARKEAERRMGYHENHGRA